MQLLKTLSVFGSSKHRISIISGSARTNPYVERNSPNITIYRLPNTSIPGLSMILFILLLPLAMILLHARKQLDVVHLPLPDLFMISALPVCRAFSIPVVARIAADELEEGHSKAVWAFVRLLIRDLILKADAIQTLNPRAYRSALNQFCHPKGVFLIPNGVEVPSVARNYHAISRNLLYVGAIRYYPNKLNVEQKNLKCLIDAFYQVSVNRPDIRLVMVGDGNYRSQLEDYTRRKGLSERVLFVGYQTDVQKYLVNADVFINPSHFEGMPNAVLEAMASGVYVICSDIPEHRFLIEDGTSGTLFDKDDLMSLASAIEQFYANPKPFIEMAARAREIAVERFAIRNVTEQVLVMFRSLNQSSKERHQA